MRKSWRFLEQVKGDKIMHHTLDIHPLPKDKEAMFINEPWLIDKSLLEYPADREQPDREADNVRVYIPLDINRDSILRRLDVLIAEYEEVNEKNELNFSVDVGEIISQVEIYDQIWFVRESNNVGDHSIRAIDLIKEVIARLEEIPDGCAECFPFETIDELKNEYLQD